MKTVCPLKQTACHYYDDPEYQNMCAWWCDGEKVCAVKAIAMELMRSNDSK